MVAVLRYVIPVAITIYALVDCISTPDDRVRNLPKFFWMILVLLFPIIGPITWFFAGRPRREGGGGRRTKPRILPPDDDPDFLRKL